jgi:hypothetical protein
VQIELSENDLPINVVLQWFNEQLEKYFGHYINSSWMDQLAMSNQHSRHTFG